MNIFLDPFIIKIGDIHYNCVMSWYDICEYDIITNGGKLLPPYSFWRDVEYKILNVANPDDVSGPLRVNKVTS